VGRDVVRCDRGLRSSFTELPVADSFYIGAFTLWLFYFDNISAEDVNLILLKQTYESLVFYF